MYHGLVISLTLLLLASGAYWAVALACVVRFLRRRAAGGGTPHQPSVSILKPVKGADVETYENFASFCRQDYPDFELLFGVIDPQDPAVAVVQRLIADFPDLKIRLLVAEPIGKNPKSSILHRLSAAARGQVLVLGDCDIRVGSDFLGRVVAPLRDAKTGLVTCLYATRPGRGVAAVMEALYLNTAFLPSAVVGTRLPGACYAFGAALAMRRDELDQAGGYDSIKHYLADDFRIGMALSSLGLRVAVSEYVVQNMLGSTSIRDSWNRQVRWARGIRTSTPGHYPGLLVTFLTPIALANLCVAGFAAWAWGLFVTAVLLRWAVAWLVLTLLGRPQPRRDLALLPIRDLMSLAIWVWGAVGRTVIWRGQRYLLMRDGTFEPIVPERYSGLRPAARALDAFLRRREKIFEYTDDPICILRASYSTSPRNVALADDSYIFSGDVLLEMHLWNEHMIPIPPEGPGMRYGVQFLKGLDRSMEEVARFLRTSSDPEAAEVRAIRCKTIQMPRNGHMQLSRILGRFDLQRVEPVLPAPLITRVHEFFENFLILILLWTFNPNALRGAKLIRERHEFWISRAALLDRYPAEQVPRRAHQTSAPAEPALAGQDAV
jgi:ceramide glucosyltransferase